MCILIQGDIMVNNDTVELLKECDFGIRMGVSAINGVLSRVDSGQLETILQNYRDKHERLGNETCRLINMYGDKTKEPGPFVRSMSWMKTNAKLYFNESDSTVSGIITDGCNMGVKTLNRYLNMYDSADEKSKNIARELIGIETELAVEISPYL